MRGNVDLHRIGAARQDAEDRLDIGPISVLDINVRRSVHPQVGLGQLRPQVLADRVGAREPQQHLNVRFSYVYAAKSRQQLAREVEIAEDKHNHCQRYQRKRNHHPYGSGLLLPGDFLQLHFFERRPAYRANKRIAGINGDDFLPARQRADFAVEANSLYRLHGIPFRSVFFVNCRAANTACGFRPGADRDTGRQSDWLLSL